MKRMAQREVVVAARGTPPARKSMTAEHTDRVCVDSPRASSARLPIRQIQRRLIKLKCQDIYLVVAFDKAWIRLRPKRPVRGHVLVVLGSLVTGDKLPYTHRERLHLVSSYIMPHMAAGANA